MFSFPDASKRLGITTFLFDPTLKPQGICHDSRMIRPGDLFVALPGKSQDGHDFLDEVFKQGASGALISREYFNTHKELILSHETDWRNLLPVPDTELALIQLAEWKREALDIPVIAITGSVGKTTTKEFLSYLLSREMRVFSSPGNFNNHLGVPLSILQIEEGDEVCVLEAGANHLGEIGKLCDLIKPTSGIITKISDAHIGEFGSQDNIYEAKGELLKSLGPGQTAILPEGDRKLLNLAGHLSLNILTVGKSENANYCISNIINNSSGVSFTINGIFKYELLNVPELFVVNAAMAIAMADHLGIKMKKTKGVWHDVKMPQGRYGELKTEAGYVIIDDTYNASPYAFKKSIECFSKQEVPGRKVLMISDMLELGDGEKKYHRELVDFIIQQGFDAVFGYGELISPCLDMAKAKYPKLNIQVFKDVQEAANALQNFLGKDDAVLMKGSRGMKVDAARDKLLYAKLTI